MPRTMKAEKINTEIEKMKCDIQKDKQKKQSLEEKKKEIEKQISQIDESIKKKQQIINQKIINNVINENGLSMEDILYAIQNKNFTSLQEKIEQGGQNG